VDVREMTRDSLLRYVGMAFQRVYLFRDTIENNIRFGCPDASREEIEELLEKGGHYKNLWQRRQNARGWKLRHNQ
jgi:ABC-type multidrug transport system fused ATPase/permease subunit